MNRSPLRIHIITEEDPFYLPVFFREFFRHLPKGRFVVTGVDLTPPLNQPRLLQLARKLYNFYGAIDFVRMGIRYATIKAKDLLLPAALWAGTVHRIAARHGIASRIVRNVNAPEYVDRLRALDLDLLISVAASQIFKQDLLSVPRLDAINIHTGPLPRYRGMFPVFWQMYDQRSQVGLTIHTMTPEIDLGEVLLSREVRLPGQRNLDVVIREMKRQGALAMLELLQRYSDDSVTRAPMNRSEAGYRTFPDRRQAAAFRKMGNHLL